MAKGRKTGGKVRRLHKVIDGVECKKCGCCKQWLPLEKFAKNGYKWDGLQERCTSCRLDHWRNLDYSLKRKRLIESYGITTQDFEALLKKQKYKCAICGSTDWGRYKVPRIDHDHSTGVVRGLLCNNCNRVLGMLKDDIVVLKSCIKYLKKNGNGYGQCKSPSPL